MYDRILHRRGTESAWNASNRVLSDSEIGHSTDSKKTKVGDGVSQWEGLPALAKLSTDPANAGRPLDSFTGEPISEGVTSSKFRPLLEPGVGGRTNSLSISPWDSNRVLAGGDMLGVALSIDGGQSWQGVTGLPVYEIGSSFTWHPTDKDTVWVGTVGGPAKSTDGGKTWSSKRGGMAALAGGGYPASAPIEKVLIDPSNPSRMLAFGGSQRQWLIQSVGSGVLNWGRVYESTDSGETWSTKSTISINGNIVQVFNAPGSLATLYALVRNVGIYKSINGGASWSLIGTVATGLPHLDLTNMEMAPNGTTLWVSASSNPTQSSGVYPAGGIWRSTDSGVTWAPLNAGLGQATNSNRGLSANYESVVRAINGDLYTADLAYGTGRRYRLPNGSSTWQQVHNTVSTSSTTENSPFVFACDPSDAARVIGATDVLLETKDSGALWREISTVKNADGTWTGTGYTGWLGTEIAFNPWRRNYVLLAAYDAANPLRTTDGKKWSFPMRPWDNYYGAIDARWATKDVVYTILGQEGGFNGVATSINAGATWSVKENTGGLPARYSFGGYGGYCVCPMSADGSVCLVVLPNGNTARTTDTGATWPANHLASTSPARYAATTHDYSVVYLATDAGIKKSADAGITWSLLAGSPVGITRLRVDPNNANIVYAIGFRNDVGGGSSYGMFRTTDAGTTWTRTSDNYYACDIAVDPANSDHLIRTFSALPFLERDFGNVQRSLDRGATWTDMTDGLAMKRCSSVSFDPHTPGRVVVGTYGRGFYEINLEPLVAEMTLEQVIEGKAPLDSATGLVDESFLPDYVKEGDFWKKKVVAHTWGRQNPMLINLRGAYGADAGVMCFHGGLTLPANEPITKIKASCVSTGTITGMWLYLIDATTERVVAVTNSRSSLVQYDLNEWTIAGGPLQVSIDTPMYIGSVWTGSSRPNFSGVYHDGANGVAVSGPVMTYKYGPAASTPGSVTIGQQMTIPDGIGEASSVYFEVN